MRRILIFGNSASGKSTLAKEFVSQEKLAHLDLDSLAWLPGTPPQRAPLSESKQKLMDFVATHNYWVIEGCYTDILELVADDASEIIFLNLSIEQCIANARKRPWEPHKYESKQIQDESLTMLLEWIGQYRNRQDVFSYDAHRRFYQNYQGKKKMIPANLAS